MKIAEKCVTIRYNFTVEHNRNEATGFYTGKTGTHSGGVDTGRPPRTSSTRKYVCPCCGMSVRATKEVRIACIDCNEQMVEV